MARIAIAGSSGMLGSTLACHLESQGHSVLRLVRRPTTRPGEVQWNPDSSSMPSDALAGCDAAINLAGETISSRWTDSVKKRIVDSRIHSTRFMAELCAKHRIPVLVNASAIGIYGNRGDEALDESSPSGGGFLADTCVAWEHALHPARDAGTRCVSCRFGMILSASGGALPRMLPLFKAGLGGALGTGRQWVSWIHLVDAVAAIEHVLGESAIDHPVVVTSPEPIRQILLAQAIAKQLHRPSMMRTPAWLLKLALGDMAEGLLLSSQLCSPSRLASTGFVWKYPGIASALQDLLGKTLALALAHQPDLYRNRDR